MQDILKGKPFLFFITALILILWYSADKEHRELALNLKTEEGLENIDHFDSPKDLANHAASSLGVPPEQLMPTNSTDKEGLFEFQQVINEFPVYLSKIQIKKERDTEKFTIIHNSLKSIPELTLNIRYSEDEIREALKTQFPQFKIQDSVTKWIYVQNNSANLVYQVFLKSKKEEREILMSTLTAEVLLNKKSEKNNSDNKD